MTRLFTYWLLLCACVIAQPELTNTEATNIDQASERQAWREALELWTDDSPTFTGGTYTGNLLVSGKLNVGNGAIDDTHIVNFVSEEDVATEVMLHLEWNSPTPLAGDSNALLFSMYDSALNETEYSRFRSVIEDPTDGSEDGAMTVDVLNDGVLEQAVLFSHDEIIMNDNGADRNFIVKDNTTAEVLRITGGNGSIAMDTDTLFVDSAGDAVGINTASPASGYLLDVAGSSGNIRINDDGNYLEFTRPSANYLQASNAAASIAMLTGSFSQARSLILLNDGNVGIGTFAATNKLQIGSGSIGFTANSGTWDGSLFEGDQSFSGWIDAGGGIDVATGAFAVDAGTGNTTVANDFTVDTDTLFVDSANNRVGVGTNTPSAGYALDVTGNTKINGYLDLDRTVDIYIGEIPSGSAYSGIWFAKNSSTATSANYSFLGDVSNTFVNGPTNLYLRTANATRATINASGIELAAGDALSFASNSGSWDGATIAGNQIFSNDVSVTGDLAVDTDTLFVDASTDRVGINVGSEPSYTLQVGGTIYSSNNIIANNGLVSNAINYFKSDSYIGAPSETNGLIRFYNSSNGNQTILRSTSTANGSMYMPATAGTMISSGDTSFSFTASPTIGGNISLSGVITSTGGLTTSGLTLLQGFYVEAAPSDFVFDLGNGFSGAGGSNGPIFYNKDGNGGGVILTGDDDFNFYTVNIPALGNGNIVLDVGDQTIAGNKTLTGNFTVGTDTLFVDASQDKVSIAGGAFEIGIGASLPPFANNPALWMQNQAGNATFTDTNYVLEIGSTSNLNINSPHGSRMNFLVGGVEEGYFYSSGLRLSSGNFLVFADGGNWDGATISGDQSMSGQVELTGQSASTDDSAMTRSLVDTHSWLYASRSWTPTFDPDPNNSGTGSAATAGIAGAYRWYMSAGSANSGWAKTEFAYGLNNIPALSGGGIEFSREIGVSSNCAIVVSGTNLNGVIRLIVGTDANTNAPAAYGADPIADDGFGVEFRYDGTNTEWRVFGHNGTTFTASSWTDLYAGNVLQPNTFAVHSDGSGNITAYYIRDGDTEADASITTTGGPTTTGLNTSSYVVWEAINSATGTGQPRMVGNAIQFFTP